MIFGFTLFIFSSLSLDNVKYEDNNITKKEEEDIITYYQSASYIYKNSK